MCAAAKAGIYGAAEVVDKLLRADADETGFGDGGRMASDLIGEDAQEERRSFDDIEHVRELLANAPVTGRGATEATWSYAALARTRCGRGRRSAS